jgi:hypothetical protein
MKTKTLSPNSSSVSKRLGSYGKKMKNGGSLGMKSVKAGYDKNPGVTRADIIVAAKKEAKSGASIKKAQFGKTVNEKEKNYENNPITELKNQNAKKKVDYQKFLNEYNKPKDSTNSAKPKPKAKSGATLKKQAAVAIAMKKAGKSPKKAMMGATTKPMMKAGGKMTKCKYGCN